MDVLEEGIVDIILCLAYLQLLKLPYIFKHKHKKTFNIIKFQIYKLCISLVESNKGGAEGEAKLQVLNLNSFS